MYQVIRRCGMAKESYLEKEFEEEDKAKKYAEKKQKSRPLPCCRYEVKHKE